MLYKIVPEYKRANVNINLDWDEFGEKRPRKICWRDGRVLDVKVLSKERPVMDQRRYMIECL